MAMAWRLPTLLATPGNLHHHDSETLSFQASLSWCRTLAPDHLLPLSSSSTSTATHSSPPFNRDQYVAFHEMYCQGGSWGCESCSEDTHQTLQHTGGRRHRDFGEADSLNDQFVHYKLNITGLTNVSCVHFWSFLIIFSIHNCDKHPQVPLMEIKYCTEKFLQDSFMWIHARNCLY